MNYLYICGCKSKNINDMNKSEAIKYYNQHRGKHDIGGVANYVKGGFNSPIFEGATIRTIKYGNRDKVISDLFRYGEYTNRELLMQNFVISDKSSEMWIYELVDAIFDYFGEQRRMSVGDFVDLCDEFSTYMGDDAWYEVAYFDDFQDEFDLAENEAAFFVEYVGRNDELVDATFIVEFESGNKMGYDDDEYKNTNTSRTKRHNVDYPSNVTLPLSGGFTKEQEAGYEKAYGKYWRDLFNGL